MAKISRRSLIARTGVGAAAAGVLVAAPSIVLSKQHNADVSARKASPATPSLDQVPTVAYVRDAVKGEIVLMYGNREVVRTDRELVAYLARLSNSPA